ncbi:MAG: prolyl oligopeptidase family serine peptidase [Gemmataceae bacterium]
MTATLLLSLGLGLGQPVAEKYPGRAMIDDYFQRQVQQISDQCLTKPTTRADWERDRPALRKQFLEMMGLWPLPEKTDLKATVTGTAEGKGFSVENLHFQSRPGLYVTANVYRPKPALPGRLPAILYVCGHGNTVENGVSYGSKVTYQYHPAWFARHGYVCIVLDTLQLGEIKGEHHGTYRLNQWWWQARGYTPGGVELWNAIRALDYLESRPDVDAKKIGVTGRSGGGATSWWVAAADDRPAAIAPVAGIADLESHVCKGFTERLKSGVITGHCDCMYMVNTYRWDFAQVAALAAPRPLLLGNSDQDDIFPVPGYRSIARKVRQVYDLYGLADRFELLETKGPHKDTPELRIGINRFMNRWLKGDTTTPVGDDLPPKLPSAALKVFKELPKDAKNETIAETFVPKAAEWKIPEGEENPAEWWKNKRKELIEQLKQKSLAGWTDVKEVAKPKLVYQKTQQGIQLQAYDIETEPGITVTLFIAFAEGNKPERVFMDIVDEDGWRDWCESMLNVFPDFIPANLKLKANPASKSFGVLSRMLKGGNQAVATFAPRGIGPTRWAAAGSTDETHIRRRFALLGQTLDGQRVYDVVRTVKAMEQIPDLASAEVWLQAKGISASIATFATIFEPRVHSLSLENLPTQSERSAILLNADKILPSPQTALLLVPCKATVHITEEKTRREWNSILTFAKRCGAKPPTIEVISVAR